MEDFQVLGSVYHMTPTSKKEEMDRWDALKAGPRGKGGHGYPDDLIIPLCDEINSLPHVCTLQSCAGHETQEDEGEYPGNLWLWFARPAFDRFLVCADEAALAPGIEQIRTLYRRYNDARVIVEIVFDGYNKGADAFDRSTEAIMRLVKRVTPIAHTEAQPDNALQEDDARIYPCADCGKMRSKNEGGTTFTVCDKCWDKHWGKRSEQAGEAQPVAWRWRAKGYRWCYGDKTPRHPIVRAMETQPLYTSPPEVTEEMVEQALGVFRGQCRDVVPAVTDEDMPSSPRARKYMRQILEAALRPHHPRVDEVDDGQYDSEEARQGEQ